MIKLDISFNTSIMTSHKPCPFCTLPTERIIDSNEFGVVIRDGYPISEGHTLIIPKRHVGSFFEAPQVEKLDLNKSKELIHFFSKSDIRYPDETNE